MDLNYDYIIIGQGLAGSALSLLLKAEGAKIFVIASPLYPPASNVAGGIINPIVLKRYTSTWKDDRFFNEAVNFYTKFGSSVNTEFFFRKNLLKIISSAQEPEFFYNKRNSEKLLADFTEDAIIPNQNPLINAPFGFVKLNNIGHLHTSVYLQQVNEFLSTQNCFAEEIFQPEKLELLPDGVRYGLIKAKKIIFCTGWYENNLPWFSFLKFSFAKGELLRVKIPELQTNDILKHKVYVIPQSDGSFLAGATYEWDDLNNEPTPQGKSLLLSDLKKLVSAKVEITGHYAGVRPSTYDRRPFAGYHPKFKNLYLFNGLGTRGAMQSPLLAAYVRDELLEGKSLPVEMDLRRCLE